MILDPTLALIRAQLGFRIQVGAECGKNVGKCQKGGDRVLSLFIKYPILVSKVSKSLVQALFLYGLKLLVLIGEVAKKITEPRVGAIAIIL